MIGMLKILLELKGVHDLIIEAIFEREILVRWGDIRILLQSAPNIASCKGLWYCEREVELLTADAVAVFYGYAAEPGTLADCGGNPWKEDYRRLAYVKDLERAFDGKKPVFKEIQNPLNKYNLGRLFYGEPLVWRLIP